MPIPHHLHRKLRETLGADAGDDLVSLLESIEALRGDVGELRHEMRLGFARIDARFEQLEAQWAARFKASDAKWDARMKADEKWDARQAASEARMQAALQKGLRDQARFFFLAWGVLLATIVGLYAR